MDRNTPALDRIFGPDDDGPLPRQMWSYVPNVLVPEDDESDPEDGWGAPVW